VHDIRMLREQIDLLRDGLRRRGALDGLATTVDRAEQLDRERRTLVQAVDERKAKRNANAQDVAKRKRAGEPADDAIAHGRELGDEIGRLEGELRIVETELDDLMLRIPNIPIDDVPAGGEEHGVIVHEWGTPRTTPTKPHWEIGTGLGIIDLERAAKISGSGFVVYRGLGARLLRSLMNYFIDTHAAEHGYEEVWPPSIVNRAAMVGTGSFPVFEDEAYATDDGQAFLIPTAEVPVTNLYRDEILDAADLPRGFVAHSKCFRREAGAAGKDTRGVLRTHEFDKVELVRYATPEQSPVEHERLTRHAETMLERLGLPYRRKLLAAGDTGFHSAKTFDLEAYAPGVGAWLEVSSCSCFTEFQARRANIRYRAAKGEKPRFVHTLNGSGLAFPRTVACILEHYYNDDGSVTVPDVLRSYMRLDRIS
jgi:seryl-tRNA synthetase